jgi:hypothetical protein
LPSGQKSLASYIAESQAYQADVVRLAAEHFRIRKFESCWGAFAFHLVDPFPAIGFGLMDGARMPKPALAALTEAFKPTRVIAVPLTFEPDRPFGILQRPDAAFSARLVVVNDDPVVSGRGVIRWSVTRVRAGKRRGARLIRDAMQRKSFTGVVDVEVPTAFEPSVSATTVTLTLPAEGDYLLEATLTVGGRMIDRAELRFTVTSSLPGPRPRPELARYLAERLADLSSLRSEPDGLSFALENQTRPAVLVGLTGLRLDGVVMARPDLQVETHAGRAPLPRRLDLPLGRTLRVYVVTGQALGGGSHSLEADITVPGVASGRLVLEGTVLGSRTATQPS